MKLEVDPHDKCILLKEVFSGVMLETSEGNQLGICMRDDTMEINVIPKGSTSSKWFRVNMQDRTVVEMDAGLPGPPGDLESAGCPDAD